MELASYNQASLEAINKNSYSRRIKTMVHHKRIINDNHKTMNSKEM